MAKKPNKEVESIFQSIWEELREWDNDDIPINRIRTKLKKLQVMVYNELTN